MCTQPVSGGAAAADAAAASKEAAEAAAREKKELHLNRREVLLAQVIVNAGAAEPSAVFPSGLPAGLPPPKSFADVPSLAPAALGQASTIPALAGSLLSSFAAVATAALRSNRPPPAAAAAAATVPIMPSGEPSPLGPLPTTVEVPEEAGPQPRVNFSNFSVESMRSTRRAIEPVDAAIKRLRGLALEREEQIAVSEIPCSEERSIVYRCYHAAHGQALKRFEAEGHADADWPKFRTLEVLSCGEVADDFIACAGRARMAFVRKAAQQMPPGGDEP